MDSSALFAGVASPGGAARALLVLAESSLLSLIVSEQVLAETERAILRKVPGAIAHFREALTSTHLTVVPDPSPDEVSAHRGIISDESDVPIVLAAVKAGVDYLVTHNRSDFLDDPGVAARTGLRIGSPGDALAWIRSRAAEGRESCGPGQAASERA